MNKEKVYEMSEDELRHIVLELYSNATQANLYFSIKDKVDKLSFALDGIDQFDILTKEGETAFKSFMAIIEKGDKMSEVMESIRNRIDSKTFQEERKKRESAQVNSPEYFALQNRDKPRFIDDSGSF